MLTGLGICYPIKDYWSPCFTASNFTHCTSTPLFRIGWKVYVKRPEGVHIFAWGKSGPSKQKQRKSSNHQTYAIMNRNSWGEVSVNSIGVATNSNEYGEVGRADVVDGICCTTISNDGGEVEFGEELREVPDEEFIYANSPDDHHREVDSGDITEKNEGGCDRKVEVCSGETFRGEVRREVVCDGFCGISIPNNDREVELREELREVRDEEFLAANTSNDHHREVESVDILKKFRRMWRKSWGWWWRNNWRSCCWWNWWHN